jgi:pilus assembly protein CpaE
VSGVRGARSPRCASRAGEAGQASVELLGALPALLLAALVTFQLLAIGYARVLAADAAEAGALAAAGGSDAAAAARAALPGWSRVGMRVRVDDGAVRVTLSAPSPIHALRRRLAIAASAAVAVR